MKKLLSTILALALMMGLFAGCSPSEPAGNTNQPGSTEPGGVTEVSFFSHVGAYKALLEQEVANWNETTGKEKNIKILMESNIDNYSTALEAMVKAGNSPDLMTYENVSEISDGWYQDLNQVKGLEDLIARFQSYLVPGLNTFGDQLIALPLELVPIKMVYNKDLFAKSGIEGPPETWDDVVAYAKKITENGGGTEYGFGFTYQWVDGFQRLALKSTMSSTGHGWFDNNNGKYNFRDFKPVIEALKQMYQDGSMFPDPSEIAIDPIRAQFAEGLVGMEIAPAYDISVYNTQFPAKCDWAVCDVPAYTEAGYAGKAVALNRVNVSISSTVPEEKMDAVVEVFKWMHSKELYAKLYANCAIIPHEMEIMESTPLEVELKNWKEMSDITNYTYMTPFPDSLLQLQGETYSQVFERVLVGDVEFDAVVDDLEARYNQAYQQGVSNGTIDTAIYEAKVDLSRD